VAETRDLPLNPRVQVRALRREAGGFYVRAAHPLARRRQVTLAQVWEHGVASVRLPDGVRTALAKLLGIEQGADVPLALECDDMAVLKTVALATDTVLGAPHSAVVDEVAAKSVKLLAITGLPALHSEMGIVTLRGRTPSPMAELVMSRLRALK
jgi:DNA-binding transcriptional LysR family regulator